MYCILLTCFQYRLTSAVLQMPIAFSVLQKQNHNILIQIFAKFHVYIPVSKSFSLPCSILTSVHFDLTGISLQITIVFFTNKKRNVYILIHICVKFNDCRPICKVHCAAILSIDQCPFWSDRYFITNDHWIWRPQIIKSLCPNLHLSQLTHL